MKKIFLISLGLLVVTHLSSISQTSEAFPLRVGAAKIDITSERQPIPPATGKYDHERQHVRAIVLDNGSARAALICLEGRIDDSMYENIYNEITTELNCPVENIIISNTHSHSSNIVDRPGRPAGASVPYSSAEEILSIAKSIVIAVRQAKANLQPARMGFGRGISYLNVNRDAIDPQTRQWTQASNLDGWSDKSVDVIKFETPLGKPIAVYMTYAIHPIDLYVIGMFSADIPGAVSRYVERAFNDEIIVAFSQGAEGDQNPLYLRPSTNAMADRQGLEISGYELNREQYEGPLRIVGRPGAITPKPVDAKILDNLFRFIESEGQVLGEEVIRVMTGTNKMTGNVFIEGQMKTVKCPGRIRVDGGDYLDPASRAGVDGTYNDGPDVIFRLGALGLGSTAITWSNGELYSFIGQRIKKESPLTNTMFVGIANPWEGGPGYVPNDAVFGSKTMQVLRTSLKPGCAEEIIVNTLTDIVNEYIIR